jgi:DNA-binding NarL/FixJ family response regulator
MHSEKGMVEELIAFGVDGYLLKNTGKDELINAIKTVMTGNKYFDSDVTLSLLNKSTTDSKAKKDHNLTEREIEILKLIAEGYTNKEIGEKLFISHRTVDTHRTNLMRKLGTNNIAGLIGFAIKNKLIT